MRVYAFTGRRTFCKVRSIREAMAISKSEAKVFVHAGFPNPWVVHPVVNGRVNRKVLIYHGNLHKRLDKAV